MDFVFDIIERGEVVEFERAPGALLEKETFATYQLMFSSDI